jgi:hypothetical protein
MTATIVILLMMAAAVFFVIRSKKIQNKKPSTFVCEQCSEQDCICHEQDSGESGRK